MDGMLLTKRRGAALAAFVLGASALAASPDARAQTWSAQVAGGTDRWITPPDASGGRQFSGQGFVIFDLRGRGVVGRGDLHVYYNTETVQVSVENVPLGTPQLEFNGGVRAEGAIAGVLRYYSRHARREEARGFFASYLYAFAGVKWLPGGPHSVELLAAGRRWLFAREEGVTSQGLALPADPWVFEPRVRYTFWRVTSPGEEWQAQVLFPRITGFAAGVELGLDLRDDASPWGMIAGTNDPANNRNRPGDAIFTARQWLRAGAQLSPRFRVQLEQAASWGEGEDDLTRVRVGGMSPYVVPIPGLPWPALLSERLLSAQASLHVRPSLRYRHEFGVAVAGGLFNDVHRAGLLDEFGGAGGVAAFADLRFWRFQAYARVGWAFPTPWLDERPPLSAMAGVGARLF